MSIDVAPFLPNTHGYSPGGSVSAGLAIYDAMQYVPCDVATVCFGMAASMGAFLLGAGAKVRIMTPEHTAVNRCKGELVQ